jgi:hypothetical protein
MLVFIVIVLFFITCVSSGKDFLFFSFPYSLVNRARFFTSPWMLLLAPRAITFSDVFFTVCR